MLLKIANFQTGVLKEKKITVEFNAIRIHVTGLFDIHYFITHRR